ncbi:MAG: nucleotidyltransferase domain-containing protein [Mycoplasmataceae bacterium]|jgi:predicted nucleotidyltransferase|nr:nucleotidyltransferase domain-containing protein [Mycoplasmataceae bacterium]
MLYRSVDWFNLVSYNIEWGKEYYFPLLIILGVCLFMDRKQIAIDFAKSLNHPEIVKIILFGSVARSQDNEYSDIDILIITTERLDKFKIQDDIYLKVMDILISTGERISIKIRSIKYYEDNANFSFLSNVSKDGIVVS